MKRLICVTLAALFCCAGCNGNGGEIKKEVIKREDSQVTRLNKRLDEISSSLKGIEGLKAELEALEKRLDKRREEALANVRVEQDKRFNKLDAKNAKENAALSKQIKDLDHKLRTDIAAETARVDKKLASLEEKFDRLLVESQELMFSKWKIQEATFRDLKARLETADGQMVDALRGMQGCLADTHAVVQGQLARHDRLFGPKSEFRRRVMARDLFAKAVSLHASGVGGEDRKALQEAALLYRRGLALDPSAATMRFNMGKALALLGRRDEALMALTAFLKTCKDPAHRAEAGKLVEELSKP